MQPDIAVSHALCAVSFILSEDALRDRFMALSGLSPDEIRENLQASGFLACVLEFLISHEPDLIAFAENAQIKPADIVTAWRSLGGGKGQEW